MNLANRLNLLVFLIFLWALPPRAAGQQQPAGPLAQCREHCQSAWSFAADAANYLQFNNGASTLDEVKSHCFDALTAIDSTDMALQRAIYASSDLIHLLAARQAADGAEAARKLKGDLQSAAEALQSCRDALRPTLDESNTDALNQQLFDTAERLENCRTQLKRAINRFRDRSFKL